MAIDSQVVVKSLLAVDPQFEALCKSLFGNVIDPQEVWSYLYAPGGATVVAKMDPTPPDVGTSRAGRLVEAAETGKDVWDARPKKKRRRKLHVVPPSEKLGKADSVSVTWDVEFSKVDDEKRQVFGWASIVEMDGQPVVDRQGDYISPEEIEKAAYNYVMKSRTGGHQHKRTEDGAPFHASDMIESIVFTPEKISKMGLPDSFPSGWWVGYKVNDEEAWQKVKKGEVTGFSVHGKGKRQEVA